LSGLDGGEVEFDSLEAPVGGVESPGDFSS
jgi:hypothetical protein